MRYILSETNYLAQASAQLSKSDFVEDETLKRAFVRSLEIIGEAVKQLTLELREKYSNTNWRAIAGMRDRLVHVYFGVDYDIVWDAVTQKIPMLDTEVREILENEYSGDT